MSWILLISQVKTCKTAYHVTCGVEQSLEMEQVLDENKDVKFRVSLNHRCETLDQHLKQAVSINL